jgi:hypothetical protein
MQVFDTSYGRDQESKQSCGDHKFRKPRDPDLRLLGIFILSQLALEIFGIVCFIPDMRPAVHPRHVSIEHGAGELGRPAAWGQTN